ncbi:MAG: helix-turn-helix domain-containing protein [Hyphomicrobium sp.]
MSQSDLKATLEMLDLKQSELAKLLDVSTRTVNQWATGLQPLPGTVAGYLRLLEAASQQMRATELERLSDRSKQLDEWVYRISYHGTAAGDVETDQALAVLRNGKILGSDRYGGVFMGSYKFDRAKSLNVVQLRMDVPPEGTLVNGYAAGPKGAHLDISCTIGRAQPVSKATVMVGGQPVGIELTYLGPLPN